MSRLAPTERPAERPSIVPPTRAPRSAAVAPLVIVAEDDDELRQLLCHKLRRHGCRVMAARTGLELAQLLVEPGHEPAAVELVITDIRMPGLTGLEIVALLRQVDWALPVIVITGFGDLEAHAEAARLGAMLFDKPVDLDVLATAACAAVGLDR